MSKIFKVLDDSNRPVKHESTVSNTDWKKCFICQEEITETVRCPANSINKTEGAGYCTIAENLLGFDNIGSLPSALSLSRLDEGGGLEDTLRRNRAVYHDSCRLQYNTSKLKRAEKRRYSDRENVTFPQEKFIRKTATNAPSNKLCFFCDQEGGDSLHDVSTFQLDVRVRKCALQIQDQHLLAKLGTSDLIAQEAKYHVKCLISLYNRAREKSNDSSTDTVHHGIAFASVVAYIEDIRMDSSIATVFKMTDLVRFYNKRLMELSTHVSSPVHTTRLKARILAYFPDLVEQRQGRDIVLISNTDVAHALQKACRYDSDDDGILLVRAAEIVRRDMLKTKNKPFNGNFGSNCQETSVPSSLLSLVSMILNGPNFQTHTPESDKSVQQAALSIAQLLMFNSSVRHRKTTSTSDFRHTMHRETPLPIYLGMMLHTRTRKKELVDILFDLGLSVSYDRVLSISTDMGNTICEHYDTTDVVCPPQLKGGIFTTSAIDNIDHNPSSTTAQDSFHGTGILLFQHPSYENEGLIRLIGPSGSSYKPGKAKVALLPESYTNVPPVEVHKQQQLVPVLEGPNRAECHLIPQAMDIENGWLNHLAHMVASDVEGDQTERASWAAFHAGRESHHLELEHGTSISALLPLFHDQAKSVSMIRHSMNVVKSAVQILNEMQVPIITVDQPLYAVAKQIQWTWPESHGEDEFIVMFGGLHIEMAALKTLGDLLQDSGWTDALVQADIASAGTADSFLRASHVTRCRRAHQVTAGALHILMQKAYNEYLNTLNGEDSPLSFADWRIERSVDSPQFHFWCIILKLELEVLIFVRSIREANFELYIEALSNIVPWFFALDHTNYARWIPVHLRDMITLEVRHPAVFAEFLKGHFTVRKTPRQFSAIAIDQAHEQNNAMVKGDGGAVGLTENPAALRRWMLCGPEMARGIGEFEACFERQKNVNVMHHEETQHTQKAFVRDVDSLQKVVAVMGNPFKDQSGDLLVLYNRDVVDTAVVETIRNIEHIGLQQYSTFVTERLDSGTKSISDTVKRNNLPLFSRPPLREKSKGQFEISTLKNDCSLFSRLYIATQTRDGDLDEFFRHENQPYPPAVSQTGKMRTGMKSQLVGILEDQLDAQTVTNTPTTDVTILDGAAIVNMLRPSHAKTFDDYASQVFLPYVAAQKSQRIDIVWDRYFPDSMKGDARNRRGKGVRRRVEPSSIIPRNWAEFMRIDDNKSELFAFLATRTASMETSKQVISTYNDSVLCTQSRNIDSLSPCNHEEADTRIIVHLEDAVTEGNQKVTIRTVDTDVVVLAVTAAQRIKIPELWVAFGTGKNFRFLPAHFIANSLGPDKSQALLMFHAFTGCDTVSFFSGVGKKKAWDVWQSFNQITPVFCALASKPVSVEPWITQLERFVILVYDRTSSETCINQARKQLFTQRGRPMDRLPPTKDALILHTKRAAFQVGHIWAQSMIASPQVPTREDWGWSKPDQGGWYVHWTTLPTAAKACRALLRCGCKKRVRRALQMLKSSTSVHCNVCLWRRLCVTLAKGFFLVRILLTHIGHY